MHIEFLDDTHSRRGDAVDHIRAVYAQSFGADLRQFAPLLVTARNAAGDILCAAGLRLHRDGFFSDVYLEGGFQDVLKRADGQPVPLDQVMEVTTLASLTPFPVLGMLDAMIAWGRAEGMTCGVFTATRQLRRLLGRAGLSYTPLCAADPARLPDASAWGGYYAQEPWVCACTDTAFAPIMLSPRTRAAGMVRHSEAS